NSRPLFDARQRGRRISTLSPPSNRAEGVRATVETKMDGQDKIEVTRRTLLGAAAFAGVFGAVLASAPAAAEDAGVTTGPAPDLSALPRVKAKLVPPPFVHDHEQVATGGPKVVEFELTIEEKELVIDDYGTTVQAMTFNGSVPGPLMVVHQDDYVELT